jgi:hypothetical protein
VTKFTVPSNVFGLPSLSALELNRIATLQEAAHLSSLSPDTLKLKYPELIISLSERRDGMRVGHALRIGELRAELENAPADAGALIKAWHGVSPDTQQWFRKYINAPPPVGDDGPDIPKLLRRPEPASEGAGAGHGAAPRRGRRPRSLSRIAQ